MELREFPEYAEFVGRANQTRAGPFVEEHGRDARSATAITAVIGAVTGVTGLLLGLWNAWRSQALRIKVQPQVQDKSPAGREASRFSVRVTNLSPFAVTIDRVYLVYGRGEERGEVDLEKDALGAVLPIELAPRKAAVMTMSLRSTIHASMAGFETAVVETACGNRISTSRWHRFRGKKLNELLNDVPSRYEGRA